MDIMWAILIIVLIGIIAAAFYIKKNKSTSDSDNNSDDASTTNQPDPLQDLVALNLQIRKSAISEALTKECEAVIDQLVDLIPAINEASTPGSEITWTVNRIATEYLPNKCILPYLSLNAESRQDEEKIATMRSNLASLSTELKDVESMLTRRNESEFNAKATFLKHRFNNDSGVA